MRGFQTKHKTATAMALLLTLGLATTAIVTSSTPTQAAITEADFTPDQLQGLQAEVDEFLKEDASCEQISINEISCDDGNTIITLVLPGETKARAIDEPITRAGVENLEDCKFMEACLWEFTNFNGARISRIKCEEIIVPERFRKSTGSIYNHQTEGTQTVIYNASGQILNANLAPSRINDIGVGHNNTVHRWRVCFD